MEKTEVESEMMQMDLYWAQTLRKTNKVPKGEVGAEKIRIWD